MIKFGDLKDLYYFWIKYQESNCYSLNHLWKGERQKNQFKLMLEVLEIKQLNMSKNGKYNGQTKAEYAKNFKRVQDIIEKSDNDIDKAIKLAKTQAARITDEWKSINRAMAAKDLKQEHIFDVFFFRAYELGNVSKQDYRDYQLQKLGI
jgi:hypothetical protein